MVLVKIWGQNLRSRELPFKFHSMEAWEPEASMFMGKERGENLPSLLHLVHKDYKMPTHNGEGRSLHSVLSNAYFFQKHLQT